jgi:threonine dehydrogenase-like Zn-dependent dehydrogenase
MKAVVYHGARDVRVDHVRAAAVQTDDDIVLRVTSTTICGSDLHLFRGKVPGMEKGEILGHEFVGVVEEAGRGVTALRTGDRVVVPFNIAGGECFLCGKQLYPACERTNPGRGAIVN